MLARPTKAQDGTKRTATASEAARDRQNPVGALDQSAGSALGTAIGAQIRILRRAVDMTAGELAERAGVSGSMLSKIERGLASPSVATLAALASALKIPVARFFTSYDERRDCSFVRAGKGVMVERRGTKCGHQYELLGHSLSGELFVEPYLVTLTEEATPYPSFQHTGIEFLYVLSGEMRYRYADRIYELRTGDALLFDATALHGPEALQRRPVTYLSVDFNLRA
jgi:mannose-6-phosphate isomerase-like protein (cupin superfamily)/DNA-binding transcriptional regulator YiaG